MASRIRRFRRLSWLAALAAIPLMLPASLASAQGSSVSNVSVVASGLKNPRGLALISLRSFFVAEAGRGGSGPCGEGPLGEVCAQRTGSLTHVLDGDVNRLAHLSSIALRDGSFAFGPHDVAVASDGSLYGTIGLAGTPESREQFRRRGAQLGKLVRVAPSGSVQVIADIAGYEARRNPDGDQVDSNVYGLLRLGQRNIVTDAGGDSLLQVSDGGRISTLAVFPNRLVEFGGEQVSMDAVPTSVVRGPDGAYYVGQLTGFPFPVHGARVFRVVPGERPEVFARGFTNIIDIAFDRDGNLYVLEIAHNSLLADQPYGALLRVSPSGERTRLLDQDDGLFFPTSVALAGRGRLLVTNCGVCPDTGEVLKVTL